MSEESSDCMSQTMETDSQWIRRLAFDSSSETQSQLSSDALSQHSSSNESVYCPVTGRRRKRGKKAQGREAAKRRMEEVEEEEEEGSERGEEREEEGDKENHGSARLDRTLREQTGSDIDEAMDDGLEEHLDSSQPLPEDDARTGEEEMEVADDVEVVAQSNDEEEEEGETTVIVTPDHSEAAESPASPPAAAPAAPAVATLAELLAAAERTAAAAAAAAPSTEQGEEGEVQPGGTGEQQQSQASLVLVSKPGENELPDADEPQQRMLQLHHELAVRLNTAFDMTLEVRAIVRTQFDLLLSLTTPQTPIGEWKQLMAAYAASEAEAAAGDHQVDQQYPSEDMTDDEKRAAHRKLARMVVTRKMQQEVRNLEQRRARANSGQVDRESE